MSEWISVEDRLPEERAIVLVSAGSKLPQYQSDAQFKRGNFYIWYVDAEDYVALEPTVTHWMKMPEPPK